jgi:hypothetical protein
MTFTMSVLLLAYLLRIFELPYNFAVNTKDFETYFSAIWCVVMSVTAVGYGDTVPFTVFGRCLIMFAALWGTFIISLMIVSVGTIFALSTDEQKAMQHLL